MTQILAMFRTSSTAFWLILACGHWVKWTGNVSPDVGDDFPCPSCDPPRVGPSEPETGRHTPGPWFTSAVHQDEWGYDFVTVGPFTLDHPDDDHVEDTIATVSGCNHGAEANARLIAAAPDLLTAAKALLDILNDDLDSEQCAAWDALNDAVAKAVSRPAPGAERREGE